MTRTAGVVLAAGEGRRFGGPKLGALLDGRPLLEHVVAAARAAGLDPVVVVVAPGGEAPAGTRAALNPDPTAGLASSVRVGLEALAAGGDTAIEAAVFLPGDQPLVRPDVIRALVSAVSAAGSASAPIVAPRYAHDAAPNPVLVRRPAWPLARELRGDRGFGPLLVAHPELVARVDVDGTNPDIDTPADLHTVEWAARVRANRAQVDRLREVPDGADFYRPVTSLFVADPRRTDDPTLDALLPLVVPGETWLDVGAGAGRYALPLALRAGEVVAVEPSSGMVAALRAGMDRYGIANIRIVEARWPIAAPGVAPRGDVALIAHVGYDVEAIGQFLDALEDAARRLCVAVLMERQPAVVAEPFWAAVHGEERVPLPALPEFLELLRARGADASVHVVERRARSFASRDELLGSLRHQLWVEPGGPKDRQLVELLDERLVPAEGGGFVLSDQPEPGIGIVQWEPPQRPA